MATKKDLVEAYSFSRRRLVTAFVSGAPGGREVEPTKPGRTIIGGAALAVLLIAGAAIAGIFSPRDPEDWNKPGLILSKETGAAYVITDSSGSTPELRPVINITSARLILEGGVDPTLVSQDTIDQQVIGDDIGILGAPASVPTPSLLIQTGWTACTADNGGIQLTVAEKPDVELAPHEGFVVESGGVNYLIAEARAVNGASPGAYSFELPTLRGGSRGDDDLDNMLGDLNVDPRPSAVRVGEDWLDLFPPGARLDFDQFGLTDFGSPVPYADSDGVPADARVGDVVTFPGGGEDRSMLLTAKGPALLDAFALAVYRHTQTPHGRLTQESRSGDSPVETTQDAAPAPRQDTLSFDAAHWPDQALEKETGDPCAVLRTAPGGSPSVVLATNPGDAARASGIAPTSHEPTVSPGRGAYVLSGDWADRTRGSAYLIDAKGRRYALVGPEVPDRLGYGDVPVVVAPDTWVELFRPGVNLSVDAALCTPDVDEGQKCE